MNITLLANIIAAIGMIFLVFSTIFKSKTKIIIFQTINQILSIISFLMLKGYTGLAMGAVKLVLNVAILFKISKRFVNVLFYLLIILVGVIVMYINKDNYGSHNYYIALIISSFPIFANLVYAISAFSKNKNVNFLRAGIFASCVLWGIYSFYYSNIAGGIFNIITMFVTAVAIYKDKKKAHIEIEK